jgi:hypothetical protein
MGLTEVLPQNFPFELRKTTKNLSQNSWCLVIDTNRARTEYKYKPLHLDQPVQHGGGNVVFKAEYVLNYGQGQLGPGHRRHKIK